MLVLDKPCYVADFETITRDGVECVWLYDICNINTLGHEIGVSMSQFIDYIENFLKLNFI